MNAMLRSTLVLSALLAAAWSAWAQTCGAPATCGQTYRLEYQTVYESKQFVAYRVEYETVCEERQVTSYKPVWETAVREHRYTVARPVTETAEREETYTVQRPVYETAEREETYTVMKPVYETSCRTEYRTVLQPVTTYQTQLVDQGFAQQQIVLKPPRNSTRLTWQSATSAVDPVTGQMVYQRAGLYWAQTPRGQYEVQQVWHPNVVAQQVPQTSYVPQTVAEQIPVQVCKYVPEQVVRKVPVQVCRIVTEQHVRKVPVTTCRTVYEERVEQIPYQVCRMVAEQQTIRVPHCVEKRVPVTYTCNVPRVVCMKIPLDACGNPILSGPTSSATTTTVQQPTPAKRPSESSSAKPELDPNVTVPKQLDTAPMRSLDAPKPLRTVPRSDNDKLLPPSYPSKST
ncbi:MAG: hypothetical protein ABFC77_13595 [Thermoguttaceae bacterium]